MKGVLMVWLCGGLTVDSGIMVGWEGLSASGMREACILAVVEAFQKIGDIAETPSRAGLLITVHFQNGCRFGHWAP